MVAITVILAAVIATFVLGLGDNLSNTAPQASFSFDYEQDTTDELTVTHDGGAQIESSSLDIASSGVERGGTAASWTGTLFDGSSEVSAGTSDTLVEGDFDQSGNLDLSGATIRVIYEGESGGSTATLSVWEGPDA